MPRNTLPILFFTLICLTSIHAQQDAGTQGIVNDLDNIKHTISEKSLKHGKSLQDVYNHAKQTVEHHNADVKLAKSMNKAPFANAPADIPIALAAGVPASVAAAAAIPAAYVPSNKETGNKSGADTKANTNIASDIKSGKPVSEAAIDPILVAPAAVTPVSDAVSNAAVVDPVSDPSVKPVVIEPATPDAAANPAFIELGTPDAVDDKSVVAADKPATPDGAANPAAVANPVTPDTVVKPATPEVPVKPATPEAPAKPATPEAPAKPATPEAPAKPAANKHHAKPAAVDPKPDAPFVPAANAEPNKPDIAIAQPISEPSTKPAEPNEVNKSVADKPDTVAPVAPVAPVPSVAPVEKPKHGKGHNSAKAHGNDPNTGVNGEASAVTDAAAVSPINIDVHAPVAPVSDSNKDSAVTDSVVHNKNTPAEATRVAEAPLTTVSTHYSTAGFTSTVPVPTYLTSSQTGSSSFVSTAPSSKTNMSSGMSSATRSMTSSSKASSPSVSTIIPPISFGVSMHDACSTQLLGFAIVFSLLSMIYHT